uniref:Uncharacterized protein n=1 Tax=Eucampia antarctica TaxID=49252 RepID=A0A7S2QZT9_9STRA
MSSTASKEVNVVGRFWNNLLEPSDDINYNFITGCYLTATVVCVCLFGVEKLLDMYVVAAGSSNVSESITELASSIHGIYLVFIPFIPCFLWGVPVRSEFLKRRSKHIKVD